MASAIVGRDPSAYFDYDLLLTAGWLVDGTGGPARADGAVLVKDGRIAAVGGPELAELAGPETPRADFPRGTLLPGLVDTHSHLSLAGDGRTYEQMATGDSDELMALVALSNIGIHLRSGVTILRDNGARNRVMFIVREAIRRGYFQAPRLLLAGRPITCTNGHFHWCGEVADGEEEVRRSVRRLVGEGADFIKIMATGGGTASTNPALASYSVGELRAAVHEAHLLERLITAHCRGTRGMANAIEAGTDMMEHAEFIDLDGLPRFDERVAEGLVKSGMFIGPTIQAGGRHTVAHLEARQEQGERLGPADQARLDRARRAVERKLETFSKLLAAGLKDKIVASTDAGCFETEFGKFYYSFELFVQGGLTPLEAIRAGTGLAARCIGLGDEVGTLEVGKAADLLAVEGDLARDIGALRRVAAVYKDGVRVPLEVAAGA